MSETTHVKASQKEHSAPVSGKSSSSRKHLNNAEMYEILNTDPSNETEKSVIAHIERMVSNGWM